MNKNRLSLRLKELRKMNHFNQEYVASYLDISRQAYSHYETGRNVPPIEALIKLSQLYHVPAEDLISLSMPMQTTFNVSPNQDYLEPFLDFINKPENDVYHPLTKKMKNCFFFSIISCPGKIRRIFLIF